MTRDEDLSAAGSGAGHKVAGYRKGGWSGKKGILGGWDQNGRDPPGAETLGVGGSRTSRGFGHRGLCLPLRSGKDGSREEAPEEERDAEHLDQDAAGSEGPGAQPHRTHPPRRDPDSRTPGHFSPRRGSRFHRRQVGRRQSTRQTSCVLCASAVAPEIRIRSQPLPERRPPGSDCTSGAPAYKTPPLGRFIPFEPLQVDAMKELHSARQQMGRTQQCPQRWKRSVFIQEGLCQRIFKLSHRCPHFTC